jgi:glutamate carboxypeptidase
VDTRFSSLAAAKELFTKIEKVLKLSFAKSAKTHEGTQTTFTNSVDTPPLPESKEAEVLMKKYVDLITQIEGRTIHGEASGGVADLNQMVRPGILIADGMGPVGGAVHTNGEFLTIDSLKTRSQALSEFLGVLEHEL